MGGMRRIVLRAGGVVPSMFRAGVSVRKRTVIGRTKRESRYCTSAPAELTRCIVSGKLLARTCP